MTIDQTWFSRAKADADKGILTDEVIKYCYCHLQYRDVGINH